MKTTFWSTIGKAVGFLIPFFIAAWFGVSEKTDAFFFAYGIILFLAGIFAPVVQGVTVPFITETRANNEDVGKFAGSILSVSGICMLALAVLCILISKPILLVVTDFDPPTLKLVHILLVQTAPLMILLVWTSVLSGVLNTYKQFALPAVSPAFRAVVNLAVIFLAKGTYGVHSIALGYVAGEFVRLAILFYTVKKLNLFKLSFSVTFDRKLAEYIKTASYQIAGMVAGELNPIVDRTMASWLGAGHISILYYADRLYMIPVTFISDGLMVPLLSHWSERLNREGLPRLKHDVKKTIKIVILITMPIMLFLILLHSVIVKMAFGRGNLEEAAVSQIGWVWICYLFGFTLYAIGQVFVRAHLVLKNTSALMKCAFYMVFLNIVLDYVFMKFFGVAGIAMATSASRIFPVIYLGGLFYKKTI